MLASLEDLTKLDGVLMAFEFTPDGKCTAFKQVTPEMAASAAQHCATVTMLFNTLAGDFSALSERRWEPQHGWMFQGGEYTVVVGNGGYRAVFVETAKADLKALLKALLVAK